MKTKEFVLTVLENLYKKNQLPPVESITIGDLDGTDSSLGKYRGKCHLNFLDYILMDKEIAVFDISPDWIVEAEAEKGGSEGIYLDVYFWVNPTLTMKILTVKTLFEDGYSHYLMNKLAEDMRRELNDVLTYKICAETAELSRDCEVLYTCNINELAEFAQEKKLDGVYFVSSKLSGVGCFHYFDDGMEVKFKSDSTYARYRQRRWILSHWKDFCTGCRSVGEFEKLLDILEANRESIDDLYHAVFSGSGGCCGFDSSCGSVSETVRVLMDYHLVFEDMDDYISYVHENTDGEYEFGSQEWNWSCENDDLRRVNGRYILKIWC